MKTLKFQSANLHQLECIKFPVTIRKNFLRIELKRKLYMENNQLCPSCHNPLALDAPMRFCQEALLKTVFPTRGEAETLTGFFPPLEKEVRKALAVALAGLSLILCGMPVQAGVSDNQPGVTAKPASDGEDFNQPISLSFPLEAGGSFSLDNVNGQTTISGWDRDEVSVKGVKYAGSQAELDEIRTDVEADRKRIVIHTRLPSDHSGSIWNWFGSHHRNARVDYVIQVPKGARLANIESVNGKLHISGVGGDIKASTVNGESVVEGAAASLKLETVNGRIKADFIRLGPGQTVSFEAVNGAIEVALPENTDAIVSASTVNGGITSEFSLLPVTKEFPVGKSLSGTLGHGGANVHATTVNGAIHFLRANPAGRKANSGPGILPGSL